jgi:peptidyl-prolyl cis-trans isomerase A (cyclophilin A)
VATAIDKEIPVNRVTPIGVLAAVLAVASAALVAQTPAAAPRKSLLNPAGLKETAPATYNVKFDTSAGEFIVKVTRDWAPNGADRFYNLVKNGYYDDVRFFRAIAGFMVQFGINGDPAVNTAWRNARIAPDPVKQSNKKGYITYAMGGTPDTRTTQVFINYGNNANLDKMGFAPFGEVVKGIEVVDKLYTGYGEGAPRGSGPEQGRVQMEGNAYLNKDFPKLDYVKKATVEP